MRKEEIDELQREMQKNLGEKWEVKPMSVKKIGGDKEAIGCRFQGDEFMVVLYPNEYENLLRSGTSIEEIGTHLAQEAEQKRYGFPQMPKTPEEFRKELYIQVINADMNEELLNNVVHDTMGDVAAVARCRIASDEQGVTSFLVTKENMECFQMTQGEIMEQAYHNTAAQKYTMQNLNEIMRELMTSEGLDPEIVKELTHEEMPLYVLTNSERVNGANAIVCPEVLQHVYEELGENYYIMPSSIHEVLLVKESTGLTPDEMKRMVHDVNVSEVRPEELLSFKIFRYDGRKLSVVNEERQEISQAKEKIKHSKLLH